MKLNDNNLIRPIVLKRVCPVCGELNKKLYGFCVYCNEQLSGKQCLKKRPLQSLGGLSSRPAPAVRFGTNLWGVDLGQICGGKRRVLLSIGLIFIVILVLYILSEKIGFVIL